MLHFDPKTMRFSGKTVHTFGCSVSATDEAPGWTLDNPITITLDWNGATEAQIQASFDQPSVAVKLQRQKSKGKAHMLSLNGKTLPYTDYVDRTQIQVDPKDGVLAMAQSGAMTPEQTLAFAQKLIDEANKKKAQ